MELAIIIVVVVVVLELNSAYKFPYNFLLFSLVRSLQTCSAVALNSFGSFHLIPFDSVSFHLLNSYLLYTAKLKRAREGGGGQGEAQSERQSWREERSGGREATRPSDRAQRERFIKTSNKSFLWFALITRIICIAGRNMTYT